MNDPWSSILAQDATIAVLDAAVRRDRLPSAYLFEGPSGVGKRQAAIALAQSVIGRSLGSEEMSEAARVDIARRIAAGTHPDVRTFGPRAEGDRNIQVDTVREQILPFTQYAPFEAKSAFVILPEADVSFPEHHPEAANSLLKTLEEPRPGVHFVLLAERPDRLLVTIRSRCQKVRFSRLTADALDSILERAGKPKETRAAAIALADGRADRALELADDGVADQLLDTALRIDEVSREGSPGKAVMLAEEMSKHEALPRVMEALSMFYRDVAKAALGARPESLAFAHRADTIATRAKAIGAAQAAHAVEHIRELEERLEQNANKEIALGKMLMMLAR